MSGKARADKEWPAHFNPKPGQLDAQWPTVRTETFVEMVFGAIDGGARTFGEIQSRTKLKSEQLGTALADLILWRKTVTSVIDEETGVREYVVAKDGQL